MKDKSNFIDNPLIGLYTIDRRNQRAIIIKDDKGIIGDDVEIAVPEGFDVLECYIVRIEKLTKKNGNNYNGKYAKFTDVNGAHTEVIVSPDDLANDDIIKENLGDKFELGADYLYVSFLDDTRSEKVSEEAIIVYIKLEKPEEKNGNTEAE